MRTTKKFNAEAFDAFYPQYKDVLGGATMVINAVYDGHSKTAALVRKAAAVQKALLHFNEELIRTYKVSYYAPETEEATATLTCNEIKRVLGIALSDDEQSAESTDGSDA